jgi:4-alpha-glucanotransferase
MSKATANAHADLWRLAHRCGVKPAYIGSGLASLRPGERKQRSSPDAVLAVLKALGVPIDDADDARDAMRAVEQQRWQRTLEPIIVHWQGEQSSAMLRLTDKQRSQPVDAELMCEDGERLRWAFKSDDLAETRRHVVEGACYVHSRFALPEDLPAGYHTLTVRIGNDQHTAKLIVAPPRATSIRDRNAWGAFIPLYALRSGRDWGVGDLTDLRLLLDWMKRHGGSVISTLPLLATYLDRPCDPSPYQPVSRLFFHELYLDVAALIRESTDPLRSELHQIIASDEFSSRLHELRARSHVDYRSALAMKRRVLEPLAESAFADSAMRAVIDREIAADPYLAEYARFRAVVERHGEQWQRWPDALHRRIRDDALRDDDAGKSAIEYHIYVQHQFRRQLGSFAGPAHGSGCGVYLDLPVGVHRQGYDAWRFADCFVHGASCGAPPDELFVGGQDWGFAPLHPERSRLQGHEWFIETVRRHLRFAGLLRIDHVMWLHRMYWVPSGFAATEGVYVRNPNPEELYAILAIESHRHDSAIVGENLGTVPDIVNRTMRRRGIYPLVVGQFALNADADEPLPGVPDGAVASINTHDTPTFAGYWLERDIDQRIEMGLLEPEASENERRWRAQLRGSVLKYIRGRDPEFNADDPGLIASRLVELLGAGQAAVVLATLEDCWGEDRPQNIPGTTSEHNWSRRAIVTLEQMFEHPTVLDTLSRLDRARRLRDRT